MPIALYIPALAVLLLTGGLSFSRGAPSQPDGATHPTAITATTPKPMSRKDLRALLRRSDLVARVRVKSFMPESYNPQTHVGTPARTQFAIEELFRGPHRLASFDLVCVCSPERSRRGPAEGTEWIVFARRNARDKIWEPADEVYEYAPTAQLRRMIQHAGTAP